MQETNEVKDDVTLEETVAENLKDEQVATEEVKPEQEGEAAAAEAVPQKKNGLKNFIQLVLFILLSMAGFIVQMIIEQIGFRIPAIKNLNEKTFNLFGLPQEVGSFIITMIAVFICKLINFILHRKVLFKARANLAFSIAMYLIFSIVLWIGSAAVKAPVKNALMGNEWWVSHITSDPEGWAVTVAVMVYSTADLIIMFFAEKFLIMNDKLFKKGREQAAEGDGVAVEGENADASAVVAEDVQAAVAADVTASESEVTESVNATEAQPEEKADDEIVILSQNEQFVAPEEEVKVVEEVKAEESASEAPVLSLEEAAEMAQEEVLQEENKQEAPKKPAAKKTAAKSTAAKKTSTAAKKPAAKTASKPATVKATATKKPASTTAKKATASTAKKTASTAKKPAAKSASASKTTAAKKTTSTAKKTTSTAKKTTAKAEEKKD